MAVVRAQAAVLDCCWGADQNQCYSAGVDKRVVRYDFQSNSETVLGVHDKPVCADPPPPHQYHLKSVFLSRNGQKKCSSWHIVTVCCGEFAECHDVLLKNPSDEWEDGAFPCGVAHHVDAHACMHVCTRTGKGDLLPEGSGLCRDGELG